MTAKWSADLRDTIASKPADVVRGGKPKTSLWFTDNETIVATFVTREDESNSPRLSRRDASNESLPLRLRAVFLDAASGKVKDTPDWPTQSRLASIVVTHSGKFVTQMGNDLTLYSPALKVLRKLQLPPTEEIGWGAHPSVTGGNIVFIASNLKAHSPVHWIWVETDSLQAVRSWEEIQSGWVGISDNNIAMTRCVWFYNCESNVEIRGFNAEWKTVAPATRNNKPHPQFVSDDLLGLSGRTIRVLRTDGTVVLNGDTSLEGCWWGGIYPAAEGQRFIVPSCKQKGRVEFLDLGGYDELKKILVYDAPFHGLSYALDVKGPKLKELTLLALSPDGSKLAILYDESVYLFQLPTLLPAPALQQSKADGASH